MRRVHRSGHGHEITDRASSSLRERPVRGRPVRGRPVRGRPVRGRPVRGRSAAGAAGDLAAVGGRCVWSGARWWCAGGWVGLVGASRVLAGRGSWGVSVVSVGGRRRVVSVGGVRGVLVVCGGRWVVSNESEVRVLEALRGEGERAGPVRGVGRRAE